MLPLTHCVNTDAGVTTKIQGCLSFHDLGGLKEGAFPKTADINAIDCTVFPKPISSANIPPLF